VAGHSTVVAETDRAIAAATHLTVLDAGAIATLRMLAVKIDTEMRLREMALTAADENGSKPPAVDNVSIPTYLKFCESLGLTPAGRARMDQKTEEPSGKLAHLRAVGGTGQEVSRSSAPSSPGSSPRRSGD
jgi:hypothetical protein